MKMGSAGFIPAVYTLLFQKLRKMSLLKLVKLRVLRRQEEPCAVADLPGVAGTKADGADGLRPAQRKTLIRGAKLMDRIIAYCGLVCSDCPACIATQADHRVALERVAAQWREQFDSSITADSILCDGCLGGGRWSGYCT